MKIGVTGAPTTGTQDMAECLSDELGLPLIAEYGEDILNTLNADGTQNLTQQQRIAFQQGALSERRDKHEDVDDFVAHRTVLDAAASYLRVFVQHAPAAEGEAYIDRCKERAESYDLIVLTHHDRSDPKNHPHARIVYYIVHGLVSDWGLPFIVAHTNESDNSVVRRVRDQLNLSDQS